MDCDPKRIAIVIEQEVSDALYRIQGSAYLLGGLARASREAGHTSEENGLSIIEGLLLDAVRDLEALPEVIADEVAAQKPGEGGDE